MTRRRGGSSRSPGGWQKGDPTPPGRGVYANRTLNLRAIKAVGYDMDYTLVHYKVEHWERRAYEHIRRRLVALGFPVEALEFDPDVAVRGLVVDRDRGNLLKVNRFGYVKAAFHGTRRLDFDVLRRSYARTIVGLGDKRFRFLNTLFDLSEGCMYAQLVDLLDERRLPDEAMGYADLHRLVRNNVDATHTEGELKAEIIRDPESYVELDAETVLTLLDQKHAGKLLLLITNSEWGYSAAMMGYAFDRFLPEGMTWKNLFDLVVVSARKPSFFDGEAPLLRVLDERGLLEPQVGPLETGGCYWGGSAGIIERHLGVSGDEILYLGDHMFGDVHVSKRALRWRTGLVLRELELELAAEEQFAGTHTTLDELMDDKERLERRYCQIRLSLQRKKAGYGPAVDEAVEALMRELSGLRAELHALDERIAPLAVQASQAHSARWGLLMRAGSDKSQLARQVERYADVYTSRVSNLLFTTPFAYLRSRRGSLPHDR
jgi:HAD superfamily 5'-nucleotidase-like hydrolase